MPVIDGGDVAIAIDKITTGDIDVNPPYGDGKTKQTAQESKSQLTNLIKEELKKLKR